MEIYDKLSEKLLKCFHFIQTGWNNPTTNVALVKITLMEFLDICKILQRYYKENVHGLTVQFKDDTEKIFVSLKQFATSVKYLEQAVELKDVDSVIIKNTCRFFYERLAGCLEHMLRSIHSFYHKPFNYNKLDELPFFTLMKKLLNEYLFEITGANQAGFDLCMLMRPVIRLILSKASNFINVALQVDKLILNALCEKVLSAYISYESEIEIEENDDDNIPIASVDCKAKFILLKSALNELEDVLYEAYLRLVYTCFLNGEKLSISHLFTAIRQFDTDKYTLKVIMADFGLNIQRTMQICVLAADLAHTTKNKIEILSCLASLESLESYVTLPALQNQCNPSLHGELLEQHFNNEFANLKNYVMIAINSHALIEIYLEMLDKGIQKIEVNFNYLSVRDLVHMANTLEDYFLINDNLKELSDNPVACRLYNEFTATLHVCQAQLLGADQVDEQHIIAILQRMHFVLNKFLNSLEVQYLPNVKTQERSHIHQMPTPTKCTKCLLESININPFYRKYFYKLSTMPKQENSNDSDSCTCVKLTNVDKFPQFVDEEQKESMRSAWLQRLESTEIKNESVFNNTRMMEINKLLDDLMHECSLMKNPKENDDTVFK